MAKMPHSRKASQDGSHVNQSPRPTAEIIPFPLKALEALTAATRGDPFPTKLEPSREQLAAFIAAMFKHATPGAYVSLRAFPDATGHSAPSRITAAKVRVSTCSRVTTIPLLFTD
jgi:hypothetical protein